MICAFSILLRRHVRAAVVIALLCKGPPVIGQQPAPTTIGEGSGAERLRGFERTYQEGLKRIHLPLLTSYLTKLTQISAESTTENPALDQEITRVQKIIAEGGLIDLTALALPEAQTTTPVQMPPPAPPPGAVLLLKSEAALGATLSASVPSALMIGEAAWSVDRLSKGNYDVLALYSLPALNEAGTLSVSFAGNEISYELATDRTTKTDQFRILRIGRLTLDRDAISETFRIKMEPETVLGLQIRQIIIAKPRLPPPPK